MKSATQDDAQGTESWKPNYAKTLLGKTKNYKQQTINVSKYG